MGLLFAGLAPISFFFFFFENMWVSVFSILGFFFLVGLPVTKFFFFQILDQNFFGLFFFPGGLA